MDLVKYMQVDLVKHMQVDLVKYMYVYVRKCKYLFRSQNDLKNGLKKSRAGHPSVAVARLLLSPATAT